jgi:RimJ/RimL family protein N-acetyltransferase
MALYSLLRQRATAAKPALSIFDTTCPARFHKDGLVVAAKRAGVASVRLRPIQVGDADLCFRWVTDPEVARHLGLTQPPRTVREERTWIAAALGARTQRVFIIEDSRERPIGTVSLRGIDEWEGSPGRSPKGTARLGLMIGEKHLWDRGYGTAAAKAAVQFAFEQLHLREVRLSCHADNPRGLRCYEKAGFQVSHLDTDYHPQVHMVITREQWESAQACPEGRPRADKAE